MKIDRRQFGAGLAAAALSLSLPRDAIAQNAPTPGGTLVSTVPTSPSHLNPVLTLDPPILQVATNIYNTLITVGSDQSIRPDLAESWSAAPDGLSYTFNLRRNVKWHDGRPFTSADVKFSFENVNRKYSAPATTGMAMVSAIETPDDHTVVFKLREPFSPFLPWSLVLQWVLPKHLYEGTDPLRNPHNLKPVGTGPFTFREWASGSHIVLEKNPNYFKPNQPYVDRVVFRIMPDGAARVTALEAGDVDYLSYVSFPTSSAEELRANRDVRVEIDRKRGYFAIIQAPFNLRNEYLRVKEVRHAIAHGIDREAILRDAVGGLGDVGVGPISSQQTEWFNPGVRRYAHDPAKANELLNQAGFTRDGSGKRFSLRFSYQRSAEGGNVHSAATMMREQLKAVGIDLVLVPMDATAWTDAVFVKWNFDIAATSFQTGPDPAIGVSRLYLARNIKPLASHNAMGYSNPAVDDIFDRAAVELDRGRRKALYDQAQAMLVDDLPIMALWEKPGAFAHRTWLHGELPPGTTHHEALDNVWLSGKPRR